MNEISLERESMTIKEMVKRIFSIDERTKTNENLLVVKLWGYYYPDFSEGNCSIGNLPKVSSILREKRHILNNS